jgi:hypothetical protein
MARKDAATANIQFIAANRISGFAHRKDGEAVLAGFDPSNSTMAWGFDVVMNGSLWSEGVNESGVAEQRVQRVPIKAQSTAVPAGTARICNAEWDSLGAMSVHGGFVHTFSGQVELVAVGVAFVSG